MIHTTSSVGIGTKFIHHTYLTRSYVKMLDAIPKQILIRLLSKYCLNLDDDLKHIIFRPELLNDHLKRVPLKIHHCSIKSIQISSLQKIHIDGVSLLAELNYEKDVASFQEDYKLEKRRVLDEQEESWLAYSGAAKTNSNNANFMKDQNESSSKEIKPTIGNLLRSKFNRNNYSAFLLNKITPILENIEIIITNVHIRIEGDLSSDLNNSGSNANYKGFYKADMIMTPYFGCGLTFEKIHLTSASASSTSNSGERKKKRVVDDEFFLNKTILLKQAGLYFFPLMTAGEFALIDFELNRSQSPLAQHPDNSMSMTIDPRARYIPYSEDPHTLQEALLGEASPSIGRPNNKDNIDDLGYILKPFDTSCHVRLVGCGVSGDQSGNNIPKALEKLEILAQVHDFDITLRNRTLAQVHGIVNEIKFYNDSQQFWYMRPTRELAGNRLSTSARDSATAKEWWSFACRGVLSKIKKQRRVHWSRLGGSIGSKRRKYCLLYARHVIQKVLRNPNFQLVDESNATICGFRIDSLLLQPLSQEEESELMQIEDGGGTSVDSFSVEEILSFRGLVQSKILYHHVRMNFKNPVDISLSQRSVSKVDKIRNYLTELLEAEHVDPKDEDYIRIVSYLDSLDTFEKTTTDPQDNDPGRVAVAVAVDLTRLSVSLYSSDEVCVYSDGDHSGQSTPKTSSVTKPLLSTNFMAYKKFFTLNVSHINAGFTLFEDFKSFSFELSVGDLEASEMAKGDNIVIIHRAHWDGSVISGEEKKDSVDLRPLLTFSFTSQPPNSSSKFDHTICGHLEQLEFNIFPEISWLHRAKQVLSVGSGVASITKFWNDLQFAAINKLEARKSKIEAKTAYLFSEHKNKDINIFIDAPVINIKGLSDVKLKIDLGKVQFLTDRVAGLTEVPPIQSSQIKTSVSDHEYFLNTPVRTPRKMSASISEFEPTTPKFSAFPVPHDLTSSFRRRKHSVSKSVTATTFVSGKRKNAKGSQQLSDVWQDNFYDVFNLRVYSLRVTIIEDRPTLDDHAAFISHDLLRDCSLSLFVEKSVIPSDHTLFKNRLNLVVDDLFLSLSDVSIRLINKIQCDWSRQILMTANTFRHSKPSIQESTGYDEFHDALSDHSSDKVMQEVVARDLFESIENVPLDFEYDNLKPAYLSSGNLEMSDILDDNLASNNEQSTGYGTSSRLSSDDASFHSAESFDGHYQLLKALEADITKADMDLKTLRDSSNTDQNASIKEELEIARLEAELRALRGSFKDINANLERAVSAFSANEDTSALSLLRKQPSLGQFSSSPKLVDEASVASEDSFAEAEMLLRAKALLKSRAKKRASIQQTNEHALIAKLNRKLFQFTVLVENIELEVSSSNCGDEKERRFSLERIFSIQLNFWRANIIHREFDTRIASTLFSFQVKDEMGNNKECFLKGSGSNLSAQKHFIETSVDMTRYSIEGDKKIKDKSRRMLLSVGCIEYNLHPDLLRQHVGLFSTINAQLKEREELDRTGITEKESTFIIDKIHRMFIGSHLSSIKPFNSGDELVDVSFRLAEVCFNINSHYFPLLQVSLVNFDTRLTRSLSNIVARNRVQWEVNVQDVHIEDHSERTLLFGSSSQREKLVAIKLRTQLVPHDKADGWVVENGRSDHTVLVSVNDEYAWNLHIGAHIGSFVSTALLTSPMRVLEIIKDSVLSTAQTNKKDIEKNQKAPSIFGRANKNSTLRWRLDVQSEGFIINLPINTASGTRADDTEIKFDRIYFTSQPAESIIGVECTVTIFDTQITMGSGLSLLSPCSFRLHSKYMVGELKQPNPPQLELSSDSSWLWDDQKIFPRLDRNKLLNSDTPGDYLHIDSTLVRFSITPTDILRLQDSLNMFKYSVFKPTKSDREKGQSSNDMSKSVSFHVSYNSPSLAVEIQHDSRARRKSTILLSLVNPQVLVSIKTKLYQKVKHLNFCAKEVILADNDSVLPLQTFGMCPSFGEDGTNQVVLSLNFKENNNIKAMKGLVNVQNCQLLVSPDFVITLISFKEAYTELKKIYPNLQEESGSNRKQYPDGIGLPLGLQSIEFDVTLNGLDLLLPVQKVVTKTLSDRSLVGVISIRFSLSLSGRCLAEDDINVVLNWAKETRGSRDFGAVRKVTPELTQLRRALQIKSEKSKLKKTLLFQVSTKLEDLSMLRSSMSAFKRHLSGYPLICQFKIEPPIAGEQQITAPFDLSLLFSSAHISCLLGSQKKIQNFGSYAIEARTGLLDVLLYNEKSSEGIHQAMKVSVNPIFQFLKTKGVDSLSDGSMIKNVHESFASLQESFLSETFSIESPSKADRKVLRDCNESHKDFNGTGFFSTFMRNSSCVISIHAEGFQITVVPGGATILTEAPMLKLSIYDLSSGIGVTRIPKVNPLNIIETLTSYELAGWAVLKISAHYHNRRLVAWEPFIEPWIASTRYGVSLSEFSIVQEDLWKTSPSLTLPGDIQNLKEAVNSKSEVMLSTRELVRNVKNKIISIASATPHKTNRDPVDVSDVRAERKASSFFISDLSYLLTYVMNSEAVENSFYLAKDILLPDRATKSSKLVLPGNQEMEWLHLHGLPARRTFTDQAEVSYPVALYVRDIKPLNINISGALMENITSTLLTFNNNEGPIDQSSPHWIENNCGVSLCFTEELDRSRVGIMYDKPRLFVLKQGNRIPLVLKRNVSHTCNPHSAFISIHVGARDGKASDHGYKKVTRVPVDQVGVYRFPLVRVDGTNEGSYIIVRVALSEGTKSVSLESPLYLKNSLSSEIACTVKNDFRRCIWSTVLLKSSEEPVPVPCTLTGIVSFLSIFASSRFSEKEKLSLQNLSNYYEDNMFNFRTVFRLASGKRGLVEVSETVLKLIDDPSSTSVDIDICFLSIGGDSPIPNQRMIHLRSPTVVKNFLPVPIMVQCRLKNISTLLKRPSSSSSLNLLDHNEQYFEEIPTRKHTKSNIVGEWQDLGVIRCNSFLRFSGSVSNDTIDFRISLLQDDGSEEVSEVYSEWSSSIELSSGRNGKGRLVCSGQESGSSKSIFSLPSRDHHPLNVAVELESSLRRGVDSSTDDVKHVPALISEASRVLAISTPYWIVNETGCDLEYNIDGVTFMNQNPCRHPGDTCQSSKSLCSLMQSLSYDNAYQVKKEVLMIGVTQSKYMKVKQRDALRANDWSAPIPLESKKHSKLVIGAGNNCESPQILLARVVPTPNELGGARTKIIHLCHRFSVVNNLDRDVEIMRCETQGSMIGTPFTLKRSKSMPLNFDDNDYIRVRPKEYGWLFSGKVRLNLNLSETTFRVSNGVSKASIIVTIELIKSSKSSKVVVLLKTASSAPFRIENYTLSPLHFQQTLSTMEKVKRKLITLLGAKTIVSNTESFSEQSKDTLLLPYHTALYAWDEPSKSNRKLQISVTDTNAKGTSLLFLGNIGLDRIGPGHNIYIDDSNLFIEVFADGSTRVLRVIDKSLPQPFVKEEKKKSINVTLELALLHGVGLSIIDRAPLELCYLSFQNINIDWKRNESVDEFGFTIRDIVCDNQLWVTPFPVLLRIGAREDLDSKYSVRSAKNNALALNVTRKRNSDRSLIYLQKVDLSVKRAFLRVDGRLIEYFVKMFQEINGSTEPTVSQNTERDELLMNLLDIQPDIQTVEAETIPCTLAINSKNPLISKQPTVLDNSYFDGRVGSKKHVPRQSTKIYAEEIYFSKLVADLSFSGLLPGRSFLPSYLVPFLSFQGAPLFFSAYNLGNFYGTLQDYLYDVKSHYINVKSVVNITAGIFLNPIFMVPATIKTTKQLVNHSFYTISRTCEEYIDFLSSFYSSYASKTNGRIIGAFLRFSMSLFVRPAIISLDLIKRLATFTSESIGNVSPNLATEDLVRVRAPRLFANRDGNDLLVEHTEGENVGKALLSRVRMGSLLSEGYVHHSDVSASPEVLIQRATVGSKSGRRPLSSNYDTNNNNTMIILMTTERLLLLEVEGNLNVCNILWEVMFQDMVMVESEMNQLTVSEDEMIISTTCAMRDRSLSTKTHTFDDDGVISWSVVNALDSVHFWYIDYNNDDNIRAKPTSFKKKSATSEKNISHGGLGELNCKILHWPCSSENMSSLVQEIFNLYPHLLSPTSFRQPNTTNGRISDASSIAAAADDDDHTNNILHHHHEDSSLFV